MESPPLVVHLSSSEWKLGVASCSDVVAHNFVMVARIGTDPLRHDVMKDHMQGSRVDPFPARVCMRVLYPDCTLLVFQHKVLIVGLKDEMAGALVLHKFLRLAKEIHAAKGIANTDFKAFGFRRANMQVRSHSLSCFAGSV